MYLAEDSLLHRDVAIKKIHPHLLERPEAIRRFNNEAKIIASLSHENIVTVYDYGQSEHERYLVMEYIDGLTLVEILEVYGILPNCILIDIFYQILSGLRAAHKKGIFHRDVKPDNVMIDRNGCVHIMDFGIAYLVNQESITLTGAFVGSPSYVAPEQVVGEPITDKSDVFSFGSLCYVCATDLTPFEGDNPSAIFNKVVNEDPVSPLSHNFQLLHWLNDFIENCLQKDPLKRPDIPQCIEKLSDFCASYGIELNRNRFIRFCEDTEKYRKEEREELYSIFKKVAHEKYRAGRYVAVLKAIDQMYAFGQLDTEVRMLQKKVINRGRLRRFTISVGIVILLLGAAYLLLESASPIIRKKMVLHALKNKESPFPAVITDSSSMVKEDKFGENTYISINKPERVKKSRPRPLSNPPKTVMTPASVKTVTENNYGYLDIRSNPPWATVYIDGIKAGATPKTGIIQLKPGDHKLVLKKQGYKNFAETVTIIENDTLQCKIKMNIFE